MAKREQFLRLMFLAELFKRKPKDAAYKEIKNYQHEKYEEKDLFEPINY